MICMEILDDTEETLLLGLGFLRNRCQDGARHARDLMEENNCEGQKYWGIGEIQMGRVDPVIGDRKRASWVVPDTAQPNPLPQL